MPIAWPGPGPRRRHRWSPRAWAWWCWPAAATALLAGAAAVAVATGPSTGARLLDALVVCAAVVAGVVGGGPVTVAVLHLASRRAPPPGPPPSDPGILHGGASIGLLERAAVTATLLTGWPEGLAVVLAVKGLGRYPELRRRGAAVRAEMRFIIGTLSSVLWGAAAAGVGTLML